MNNDLNMAICKINEEMQRVRLDNRLSSNTKMEILKSFNNVIKNINKIKDMNDDLER